MYLCIFTRKGGFPLSHRNVTKLQIVIKRISICLDNFKYLLLGFIYLILGGP